MSWLLLALLLDTGRRPAAFDPKNTGLLKSIYPGVGRVYGCDFSPDGEFLAATGENGKVQILRSGTWAPVRTINVGSGGAWTLRYSADGKRIAVGCLDGSARVFDTSSGAEVQRFGGHSAQIFGISWSPDGAWIASASVDNTVRIWGSKDGKEKHALVGHTQYPYAVLFTPDGSKVVSCGYDATIRVWDVATGTEKQTLVTPDGGVTALAISPDGRTLYTGSADGDASIREWELATGKMVRRTPSQPGATVVGLRLMPDARHLVSVGGIAIQIWDLRTMKCVAELKHHTGGVNGIAISRNARWVASAGLDCHVKIWGYLPGGMARVRPKGFFGIRVQDAADGVEVTEVIEKTAAASAGIRNGDVITRVAGQKVANSSESIAAIGSYFEGDEVEFTILRGGAELTIRAKLGKRGENQ